MSVVCGGATRSLMKAAAISEYRRVLRPYGFLSITNLFYRSERLRNCGQARDVLGFDMPTVWLTDWIRAWHLQSGIITSRHRSN